MTETQTIGQRMADAARKLGKSLDQIAREAGYAGASSIQRFLEPDYDQRMRTPQQMQLLAVLGLQSFDPATPDVHDDYVFVPEREVAASAGNGSIIDTEDQIGALAFKAAWIKKRAGGRVTDMSVIRVDGTSMAPTLEPGDRILVDQAVRAPGEGLYVLRIDGELLVKRLTRMPGGRFTVKSDNPAFSPIVLEGHEVEVCGRVLWIGRAL